MLEIKIGRTRVRRKGRLSDRISGCRKKESFVRTNDDCLHPRLDGELRSAPKLLELQKNNVCALVFFWSSLASLCDFVFRCESRNCS